MARMILSALFAPKPSNFCTRPDCSSRSKSSTVQISSSSNSLRAFLGPTPSKRISSTNVRGNSAETSSMRLIFPVSSSSPMYLATLFPTPGNSVRSSPASSIE